MKPKKINMKKIQDIIVGLKTYEVRISEEKLLKYIEFSESHKNP